MNVVSIFDDARSAINARSRAYYADNKDYILKQKRRAYQISHRDATNARQREYVARNKGAINARKRADY